MKSTPNLIGKPTDDAERRGPSFPFGLFGGRIRTSTVVLIVALVLVAWVYNTYRPEPPVKPPTEVVPPGFVPDPNYTWVPRTRVDQTQQPTTTAPKPPTPTETTTPSPTTTTTATTPPFTVPCLVPALCPPSTSPTAPHPQLPEPGPGPVPTSAPPAS